MIPNPDTFKIVPRLHPWILLGLWFVIHMVLLWHYGIRMLYDAQVIVQLSDYLLDHGKLQETHQLFYSIPIGLLAIFRLIFPGEVLPFLIFQILISGLASWAMYKASAELFHDSLAGFFAGVIFLFWWDSIHWNVVTMTESLMRSIICFLILHLVRFKGERADYLKLLGLLTLLVLTRPTGIIVVLSGIIFCLSYAWNQIKQRPAVTAIVALLFIVIAFLGADQMFRRWDFTEQYAQGNVITYANLVEANPLDHESLHVESGDIRFDTTQQPSLSKILSFIRDNPTSFLKAGFLKIGFLVSGVRPYYSTLHNIYTVLWLLGIYMLFAFGLRRAQNIPIKFFTIAVIVLNCLLIGMSTVDWDNRFYIPMEPGIIMMAGGGGAFLVRRLQSSKKA